MSIVPMLGRFGAQKDTSPEEFAAGIEIQGAGPGKSASRYRKIRPRPNRYAIGPFEKEYLATKNRYIILL